MDDAKKEEIAKLMQGQRKLYVEIDYNSVQRAIEMFYGIAEYCLPAEEELSNDSVFDCHVTGQMSEHKKNTAEYLMENKITRQWSTRAYLDYMAMKGAIDPGNYLISICW